MAKFVLWASLVLITAHWTTSLSRDESEHVNIRIANSFKVNSNQEENSDRVNTKRNNAADNKTLMWPWISSSSVGLKESVAEEDTTKVNELEQEKWKILSRVTRSQIMIDRFLPSDLYLQGRNRPTIENIRNEIGEYISRHLYELPLAVVTNMNIRYTGFDTVLVTARDIRVGRDVYSGSRSIWLHGIRVNYRNGGERRNGTRSNRRRTYDELK